MNHCSAHDKPKEIRKQSSDMTYEQFPSQNKVVVKQIKRSNKPKTSTGSESPPRSATKAYVTNRSPLGHRF